MFDRQVEEISGLFERTGPMRDDDAGDLRVLRKYLVNALRKCEPNVERDIRAANVADLLNSTWAYCWISGTALTSSSPRNEPDL